MLWAWLVWLLSLAWLLTLGNGYVICDLKGTPIGIVGWQECDTAKADDRYHQLSGIRPLETEF